MNAKPKCDRCGIAAQNTEIGVLAYNGPHLVCADCDDILNDEWVAEGLEHRTHPIDALVSA